MESSQAPIQKAASPVIELKRISENDVKKHSAIEKAKDNIVQTREDADGNVIQNVVIFRLGGSYTKEGVMKFLIERKDPDLVTKKNKNR